MKTISCIGIIVLLISIEAIPQAGFLDHDFDADGILRYVFADTSSEAFSIAVQPDNKIIACGYAYNGADMDFLLTRMFPDGSPDNEFGNEGKVFTDFGGDEKGFSLVIQPDGKIVVAGSAKSDQAIAVARYLPDGRLDDSFNFDGKDIVDIGIEGYNGPTALLQDNGKILIATTEHEYPDVFFAMTRYNEDGTPDTEFNPDNKAIEGNTGSAVINPDGKIHILGKTKSPHSDFKIARFNADGSPDDTFNFDGEVVTSITNSNIPYDIELLDNGKLLVTGYSYNIIIGANLVIIRYNSDGTIDDSFGVRGMISDTEEELELASGNSLEIQPDNKIIVGGTYYDSELQFLKMAVARYSSQGTLDTTFGNKGKIYIGGEGQIHDMAIQNNGKILFAGSKGPYGSKYFSIGRLTNDIETGLLELTGNENIRIYPNPFTDVINVTRKSNHKCILRVLSISGKTVYTATLTNEDERIKLDFLRPGAYVFNIVGGKSLYRNSLIKVK